MFHVPEIAKVCAWKAAHRYHVPYGEMLGILHTEGGGYGVIDVDSNGTEDLGWAQINTCHLPFLRQFGITREVLLTRPCVNIAVGAYILREAYDATGNWFAAAEGYNAGVHNLSAGYHYAKSVFSAWRRYAGGASYTQQHWKIRVKPTIQRRVWISISPFTPSFERAHFVEISPPSSSSS